jgi:hypothetical protein
MKNFKFNRKKGIYNEYEFYKLYKYKHYIKMEYFIGNVFVKKLNKTKIKHL